MTEPKRGPTRLQRVREQHRPRYVPFRRGKSPLTGRSLSGCTVTCACGWSYRSNEGKADAVAAWRDHTREVADQEAAEAARREKLADPGMAARIAALEAHRAGTQFRPLDPASPTVLMQVRLPRALLERVDEAAAARGVTRSELVREALEAISGG